MSLSVFLVECQKHPIPPLMDHTEFLNQTILVEKFVKINRWIMDGRSGYAPLKKDEVSEIL